MTPKQFAKFLKRDGHCLHCGSTGEDLIPHHRMNRGQGGKNGVAGSSANIIVMCSAFNGLMESDAASAEQARANGWKLASWQKPAEVPVYDAYLAAWFILDTNIGRNATEVLI